MNVRAFTLCALLLAMATPLAAGDKTDLVVLKNGDRLTCEIKGLNSGVLNISLDYALGTISVDWAEVAQLRSPRMFIVKAENGSVYEGGLSTVNNGANGGMQIEITDSANLKVSLGQSEVIQIDPTANAFWQRFSGSFTSGLTYSKGNQATQYNLSSETEYLRERWRARANFYSNLASSNGATTSTRNQLNLSGRHLLRRSHYFYGGLVSFLQSSVQAIQLQTVVGAGIGRFLKETNSANIAVIAGAALQRIHYDPALSPLGTQDVAAAMIGVDVELFRFDRTRLDIETDVFPAISDPGRVYATTNISYFVKLFGKLSWNVTAYGNVDTRPPTHLSKSDYGTTSGLSLSFGNR